MSDLAKGFLPHKDPLKSLSKAFHAWETTAANLPKLLLGDQLRSTLEKLPQFPVSRLRTPAEWERAMLLLSFLGHAYVWGAMPVSTKIASSIAIPWHAVAKKLGRPPVLS